MLSLVGSRWRNPCLDSGWFCLPATLEPSWTGPQWHGGWGADSCYGLPCGGGVSGLSPDHGPGAHLPQPPPLPSCWSSLRSRTAVEHSGRGEGTFPCHSVPKAWDQGTPPLYARKEGRIQENPSFSARSHFKGSPRIPCAASMNLPGSPIHPLGSCSAGAIHALPLASPKPSPISGVGVFLLYNHYKKQ